MRPASRLASADRLVIQVGRTAPGWALLLVAGMCTVTAVGLLVPASLAAVADAVIAHHDATAATVRLAAILTGGALGSLAVSLAGPAYLANGTAWLGHRLMRHVICLGTRGQERSGERDRAGISAGDLTSRLLDNVPSAANAVPSALEIALSLVTSLGAVTALWLTDWMLGAVFLLAAGPVVMIARGSMRGAPATFLRYARAQGNMAARLSEGLSGIRTIQSSGTMEFETERILRSLPELSAAGRATWSVQRRLAWRTSLCFALMELAVLATAGFQVAAGRLSAGEWLAASGYTTLAMGVFGQVDSVIGIAHSRAAATRVAEVLDVPVARTQSEGSETARLADGGGHLVYRRVTVRSGTRPVLDRLDLDIPAGVTAAIVGLSGAGKSTLTALVGGLAEPDEGKVLIDGTPVSRLPPPELRRGVAYAFARPACLGKTVADDIGYGSSAVSRREIVRAARMARAHDFIQRLPDGYDTPMERTPLSGGERQRLGIARAIAADARVLVFDDATSSLDTATEAQISDALTELRAAKTTLIVTHRASTAARADTVVWLDHGRVRKMAPHAALWPDAAYRAVFSTVG